MAESQNKEDEKFNETIKRMLKTPPDPKTPPKPKLGKASKRENK